MTEDHAKSQARPELAHTPSARSIREVVFGVNDGLVSITGLLVGITASNMSAHQIVIAGLAAITAATIAMGLGAYLSTSAQNEYFQAEWDREMREVHEIPHEEQREVEGILHQKGFTPEESRTFTQRLMTNKQQWVDFMMKEELGIMVERLDSPWRSAGIMALAVIVGSLPPMLPYVFSASPFIALRWAIALAVATAFGLGVTKARVARGIWWKSGLQFVAVAGAAVVVGIFAGHLFGTLAAS
jgi:VIT1/CCC1 family predicted Fe2+/Mn2+ transporter